MESLFLFASGISVLTVMIVEFFKHTTSISERYLPLTSLSVGILVGAIALVVPEIASELSIGGHLLAGGISGLAASGLYDLTTNTIKGDE